MSESKQLSRSLERWEKMNPAVMAGEASKVSIMYMLVDAKNDIALLAAQRDELLVRLKETADTYSMSEKDRADPGLSMYKEIEDKNLAAIAKAEQQIT